MAEQNSHITPKVARVGIDMDSSVSQIPNGKLSYALNAALENFDANSTSYQNEPGNINCLQFPDGYINIGNHFIPEQNKHIFFLTNPDDGGSEIGHMDNNDCLYHTYVNDSCLNFSINYPIKKSVHKITNCTTEIYWTDGLNSRRFMDLNNIPYLTTIGDSICDVSVSKRLDCNRLKIQPNFDIPQIEIKDVVNGGNITAGTIQFAIQYSDSIGDGYTSYYSVTNPLPIYDNKFVGLNFNYNVDKSILLNISNIDVTGYFKYFNLAVIKTVNAIVSVELIGTYFIEAKTKEIIYSGQNQSQIRLVINNIINKLPYYDIAQDVTSVQDVIVWDQLISIDRINYQQIANKIELYWQTYRIPATENYANPLNAEDLRGYLRDEIYAFEIAFLLKNGKQTDGFHIPGRAIQPQDLPTIYPTNNDFVGIPDIETGGLPTWKIYNTAIVTETSPEYTPYSSYKGNYQTGIFSYWESTETYPCNTVQWGELAGQPIRHHKFPDSNISPHFESSSFDSSSQLTPVMEDCAVFPIGVRLNVNQIISLIEQSNLTSEQKSNIAGFKILRGDRATNKSITGKGILRNVGKYTREDQEYYFANYPYNDLEVDPFLLEKSNAYNSQCNTYTFICATTGKYQYTDCFKNTLVVGDMSSGEQITVCSLTKPEILTGTITGSISQIGYDLWSFTSIGNFAIFSYTPVGATHTSTIIVHKGNTQTVQVKIGTTPSLVLGSGTSSKIPNLKNDECYPDNLSAFTTDESKYRMVFNSPETSFGQPFLGDILKLEGVIFGGGKGHFVEVKKEAFYKLLTYEAQEDALDVSFALGGLTTPFNGIAMFTAYQAYLQLYLNGITRKNYAWSYNSIASYNYLQYIPQGQGILQRKLDLNQYLSPVIQSTNDNHSVNNYYRESSIYLKTDETKPALDFPSRTQSMIIPGDLSILKDRSRYIASEQSCSSPNAQFDIDVVSYYGSLKNNVLNQWGQIYTYDVVDTGFQHIFNNNTGDVDVFGGDTFINKFALKTKLPFFIDNRVGANDDSDVYYDEIGNVAYPQFWHSSRSIIYSYGKGGTTYGKNLISIKAHYFDCPNNQLPVPNPNAIPPITNPGRTYYDGKMYLFAYGIPYFYCESSINTDLRQAFNDREGDYYPHVTKDIPDDWVQESRVPIAQDNTYYYNTTYSKQNKENYFSHLPIDWEQQLCFTNYPFRAVYSETQQSFSDNRVNSWLIYKPSAYFDFPQNYGALTSLDGIDNRQVLARFVNKSLLYNALYTTQVNTGGQVYLGQNLFSANAPPLDYAETDLGYIGSQHKFLLKIPQGRITIDAKRGQVFLLNSNGVQDLSAYGSGLNRFFTDHLSFEILRYFPDIDIDNNFKDIGLHGVYDSKYDRVIISKLDYIPLSNDIKYDIILKKFYIEESPTDIITKKIVDITDSDYFCNKSWTVSFNVNTNSWVSFHSYIPNWYIAENNFFYSGINEGCDLEAIAAQEIPTTTTTSTTTTQSPRDCNLEGFTYLLKCELDGFALGTTTTSTTTTTSPDCLLYGTAFLQ